MTPASTIRYQGAQWVVAESAGNHVKIVRINKKLAGLESRVVGVGDVECSTSRASRSSTMNGGRQAHGFYRASGR